MQKMNGGKPLNEKLSKKIHDFFDYKWTHDRLMAIDGEDEQSLLEQLPEFVQNKLISHYLFGDFLMSYMDFFRILNAPASLCCTTILRKYYTWNDQEYRDFMVSILTSLEPFREGKKVTLIEEFDEFNIIQFVISGKVLIGFKMNHKRKYCIKFENKCIIGAYGATFNARASFIYTTYTPITGFFIRKEKWK